MKNAGLAMNFSSYHQLECDYFNLYNQFLRVDFKAFFTHGRNRELVKEFMLFYRQIIKKESLTSLANVRNKIALSLNKYAQEHSVTPVPMSICTFYDKDLESFNLFYKAVAYFISLRKKLSSEQKLQISQQKLEECLNHHFELDDEILLQFLKKHKTDSFTIPKQCLNDFHEAMVHFCVIYLKPNNAEHAKANLDKANICLKNGAFNAYNLILKDYFILVPDDEALKLEFVKIKELEYKLMYGEKKVSEELIFEAYKRICDEVLYNVDLIKFS